MRLYATVTSERASKSQGGNEKIVVEFFVGSAKDSKRVAEVRLTPNGNNYMLHVLTAKEALKVEIKGK